MTEPILILIGYNHQRWISQTLILSRPLLTILWIQVDLFSQWDSERHYFGSVNFVQVSLRSRVA